MIHKKRRNRHLWAIIFSLFLVIYSTFSVLEAFVIPSNVVTATTTAASSSSSKTTASTSSQTTSSKATGTFTDTTYTSDDMTITITKKEVDDTMVYIADIQVTDTSLLKSGLANGSFGRNISATTSTIAEEVNAVLAINGDYYGFRDTGYVMRNGYLYRSTKSTDSDSEDLVVYDDGTMEIVNESDVTAEELQQKGAVQIYSFGPGLVENGKITVDSSDEVSQSMNSNPRTAIGMVSAGHYVMVVSDGRTSESAGLTLEELAGVMQDAGCTVAYNLDGGGSTTMVFNGEVINKPTTNGNRISERAVSDIVYFGE